MVNNYNTLHDFLRALPGLIETGATLRQLYNEMAAIREKDAIDTSSAGLRTLASRWTQAPDFIPIRLSELFDRLVLEHNDDYVLAMVGALGDPGQSGIREYILRHDHQLREEVFWRVFEVEGGGEISLANVDRFSSDVFSGPRNTPEHLRFTKGWQRAVLTLTAEGTLPRARVLRSCLEALNRDFSAYRAGWFSRLYTALAPTGAEAAADQDLLLLTLQSSLTASVSLAVKQLRSVHKAGLLDTRAFVEACGPALVGAKAGAMTVLQLLAAIGAKGQIDPDAVARVIAHGSGHAHPDVQRATITALFQLNRADLARANRDLLAPAVAAQFLLLDAVASTPSAAPPGSTSSLPDASPVRPWTNMDARHRYAILLEDASDAIEFELALSWLASTENPDTVLAPLVKRAEKRIQLAWPGANYPAALLLAACVPEFEFFPRNYCPRMAVATHNDEAVTESDSDPEPISLPEAPSPIPSLMMRLREVAAIVQGHARHRVLLATPTDSHGWIAPHVFRDRFRAHRDIPPFPADETQALLRLHPDGRETILNELKLTMPPVTTQLRIEWHSLSSGGMKSNGEPQFVWWRSSFVPVAISGVADETSPAVILPEEKSRFSAFGIGPLSCAEIGLIHPPSTLPLVARAIGVMHTAVGEGGPNGAEHILRVLRWHPGAWSTETMQLVALGMAANHRAIRAQATELIAAVVPARITVAFAAEAFAACAPAVVLTRWAASFTDAAALIPTTVIDLLAALLPRISAKARGVSGLITALHNETIRHQHMTGADALVTWLDQFSGASATAKAAKALRAFLTK